MPSLSDYLKPDVIQQVARLDMRARFIVEGFLAGLHRSPFQGLSTEFSEHRKYAQGDDLRTLDWNVFARTDRLFVRKYAAETHMQCHLIVDASGSMGPVGQPGQPPEKQPRSTKLDYAVHLAAALGYLVTQQQDAIGLAIVSAGVGAVLPPRSRRADLVHLLATLSAARPRGPTRLAEGIHRVVNGISHRGLIILLSDLLTDPTALAKAIHHIRFRGHDLIVMHILDHAEVALSFQGPVRLEDPESGAWVEVDAESARRKYQEALENWRSEWKTRLAVVKADYVPLDTSMPFDKALVEFLIQRSRRR